MHRTLTSTWALLLALACLPSHASAQQDASDTTAFIWQGFKHEWERHVLEADLVIGGVLIPGAAAPKLVTAEMVSAMKPGSVIVDVAIDQGGCCETSRPTTHAEPTYVVDDIVHYCVANMPGAVARTSTYALNNATLIHALRIADKGWKAALQADPHLAAGLNVWNGRITYPAVAESLGLESVPLSDALA